LKFCDRVEANREAEMSDDAEDGPRLLPAGVPPTGQVAFVVTDLDVAVAALAASRLRTLEHLDV
jgi:hypothetical protein